MVGAGESDFIPPLKRLGAGGLQNEVKTSLKRKTEREVQIPGLGCPMSLPSAAKLLRCNCGLPSLGSISKVANPHELFLGCKRPFSLVGRFYFPGKVGEDPEESPVESDGDLHQRKGEACGF